jgi:hypothetical protein
VPVLRKILVASVIVFTILVSYGIYIYQTFSNESKGKSVNISSLLKNGDLVLRRGRSVESFAVVYAKSENEYSHIGITVFEKGKPYIIHIIPDAPAVVRKDTPEEFLSEKNSSRYCVLRPKFPEKELKNVTESAELFFEKHILFDDKYNLADDAFLYCSELVLKSFSKNSLILEDIKPQNLNFTLGNHKIIMPNSFVKSSHFTGVISG